MFFSERELKKALRDTLLGSFRFDYEYEIEYEYDFRISNQDISRALLLHVGFR